MFHLECVWEPETRDGPQGGYLGAGSVNTGKIKGETGAGGGGFKLGEEEVLVEGLTEMKKL